MIVGVVSNSVAIINDLLKQHRVFCDIISYAKERRFETVTLQLF
jgi:hypothetical protein